MRNSQRNTMLILTLWMLPIIIFSSAMILFYFLNETQINDAKINGKVLLLKTCILTSKENPLECTIDDVQQEIKSNLESINSALKLEEMVALFAIFATISSILIPFIVFANLKQEKQEIQKIVDSTINETKIIQTNILQSMKEMQANLNNHQNIIDRALEKLDHQIEKAEKDSEITRQQIVQEIRNDTQTKNTIMTNIYATKSIYISDKYDKSNFDDIVMTAQTLELKLFKLMSNKNRDIENSFAWLKQSINYRDIYNRLDYIHQLYITITIMQSSGYFIANAVQRTLYDDFLIYLGNQTPD